MTNRFRLLRVAAVLIAALPLAGCPDEGKPRLYQRFDAPPQGLFTETTPALWHEAAPGQKVEVTQDLIGEMKLLGSQLIVDAQGGFRGVNFSVYSQRAEKVRLLLFDDPESDKATRWVDMARLSGSEVWNVYVEGVGLGQHYGYVAWGPNWQFSEDWYPGSIHGFSSDVDQAGNRFNPNKLLFDPYCKIFHRDHDWGKGSLGSGPQRIELTYGASMKCRVVQSSYQWSENEKAWRAGRVDDSLEGHHWNELVLYEVHPKGFTANSSSGVQHTGTFRGFGEKAQYFVDLGVNAVELLPPFEKPLDGGYWGYNTIGFFAPERSYLTRNEMAAGIDEFKGMVDQLHQTGVEVILDVVYNHSGEGGLWRQKIFKTDDDHPWNLDPVNIASLFAFRGLDNASYYALPPGNGREYCDYTGVGNTMRCNAPPMQRLIIDSLRYWVEEMHVDGYRFDLAPALGAKDGQYDRCPTSSNKSNTQGIQWDPKSTIVQTIIDDPVLQKNNTRIIAEPWGGGGYPVGQFTATGNQEKRGYGWGEWNNKFRDWWRSFVNQGWVLNSNQDGADGGYVIAGSEGLFKHNGRKPFHSVNFVTCHDGMTMYDVLSYDQKVNGCSPLNPVCCNDPMSSFCDESEHSGTDDNRSRNWSAGGACGGSTCGFGWACYQGQCVESELFKRQLMRNFFMAMMFSHGTPMIFGGDEWMRTQLGNNNTYTPEADNAYSWHDWGQWQAKDERWRLYDFLKDAIRFRKEHLSALSPLEYGTFKDEYWRNADNTQKAGTGWDARSLMIHFSDRSKGPEVAILINMEEGDVTFTLPPGKTWKRLIDTQYHFDMPDYLNERRPQLPLTRSGNSTLDNPETMPATYSVRSRSIVAMEAK
ncbi:MAG: glycosyl hydrolase [Deltaproteobacteria bacterium]|nr:glycosyl hydrolase [Deltaproteobacteria bacterium]